MKLVFLFVAMTVLLMAGAMTFNALNAGRSPDEEKLYVSCVNVMMKDLEGAVAAEVVLKRCDCVVSHVQLMDASDQDAVADHYDFLNSSDRPQIPKTNRFSRDGAKQFGDVLNNICSIDRFL